MTFWGLLLPYIEQQAIYDQILNRKNPNNPSESWGTLQLQKEDWWDQLSESEKNGVSFLSFMKCPTRRTGVARCNTGVACQYGWGTYGIIPRGDYTVAYFGNPRYNL